MRDIQIINYHIYLSEYSLQAALAQWLEIEFPNVLFHSDLSGVRMPIGLANKMRRVNPYRGFPDMFIAEARGKYHGLFIELKRKKEDLYTKQGKLRQTQHIKEQAEMLRILRERGYYATFSWGFEPTQALIRNYLNEK